MKANAIQKNRIEELRRERGLSSLKLSKIIGTSAPHMSRLENGQSPLSIKWIAKIADALKVNSSEIIDLPFDNKFTKTCDEVLLGSAIDWLLEASAKYKVKLSRKELSKWASYIYKEAVEQPLNYDQTKYLALTIIRVLRKSRE